MHAGSRVNGEVSWVNQPLPGAAAGGIGRDPSAIGNGYGCRTGLHKPAITAIRCRRIQRATHFSAVVVHATQQVNLALFVGNGLGAHLSGVVHHRRHHRIQPLGGQHHQTAIGVDGLFVLHQCIQCALVDGDAHQRVAIEVQADLVACRQDGGAQAGANDAFVLHLIAQQRHVAAVCGVDGAQVDDAGLAAVSSEGVAPRHEVGIADVQGRGHQTADVDAGSAGEQHAVGVEQKHLAIGVHGTGNHRLFSADHAVKDHRRGIGLLEVDRGVAADREALPVDGGLLRRLLHGQCVGGAADAGCAGADLPAAWQDIHVNRERWHRAGS